MDEDDRNFVIGFLIGTAAGILLTIIVLRVSGVAL